MRVCSGSSDMSSRNIAKCIYIVDPSFVHVKRPAQGVKYSISICYVSSVKQRAARSNVIPTTRLHFSIRLELQLGCCEPLSWWRRTTWSCRAADPALPRAPPKRHPAQILSRPPAFVRCFVVQQRARRRLTGEAEVQAVREHTL
jgi:hypothetical protein